ncbi:hypothetical protein BC831DRAFT_436543 [Entophlyctis helioformis]|nr:hypothetical protein BC831DRAFT_436543 [Entophlyctis helioformis]
MNEASVHTDEPSDSHENAAHSNSPNGSSNASSPPTAASAPFPRVLTSGVFVPTDANQGFHAGVLHLYRSRSEVSDHLASAAAIASQHTNATAGSAATPATALQPDASSLLGTIVAVLAVPLHVTPQDFLKLMGAARKSMTHLRIIRDSLPNRFIMLLKFKSSKAAYRFYSDYNGRPFNSFEPEVCHVVFVKSVEFDSSAVPPYAFPPAYDGPATAFFPERQPGWRQQHAHQQDASESGAAPTSQPLLELPTCPVCLERMDASATGLLTIVCHHTFHCSCIMKWGDSTCPVCRYSSSRDDPPQAASSSSASQTPTSLAPSGQPDGNACFECASQRNLWICLICGNIGCGRYVQGHAHKHFTDTSHVYSLELETQRVWDYAGDGYVHRIIQNKADGKLVELPPPLTGPSSSNANGMAGGGMASSGHARHFSDGGARGGDGFSRSHRSSSNDVGFASRGNGVGKDDSRHKADGDPDSGSGLRYSSAPGYAESSSAAGFSLSSSSSSSAAQQQYLRPRRVMGLDTLDPNSGITEHDAAIAEKVDLLGTQYAHLIASQLDTQRKWYEGQMSKVEVLAAEHVSLLDAHLSAARSDVCNLSAERDALKAELDKADRERKATAKRIDKLAERVDSLHRQVQEERAMSTGLLDQRAQWLRDVAERDARLAAKDAEIAELTEQVRDLMFFVETQQKLQADQQLSDELREATVVGVAAAPQTPAAGNGSGSGLGLGLGRIGARARRDEQQTQQTQHKHKHHKAGHAAVAARRETAPVTLVLALGVAILALLVAQGTLSWVQAAGLVVVVVAAKSLVSGNSRKAVAEPTAVHWTTRAVLPQQQPLQPQQQQPPQQPQQPQAPASASASASAAMPAAPKPVAPPADPYAADLAALEQRFVSLCDMDAEPAGPSASCPWQAVLEKTSGDFFISVQQRKGNDFFFRVVIDLQGTPEDAFDVLADIEGRPAWDDMCESAGVIAEVSPVTKIQYMRTKGVWPTAPRDALVVAFVKRLSDGRYLNVTKSVDSHPDYEPESGDVRMLAKIAGVLVGPHPTKPNLTRCYQLVDGDLGGWLPKSVVSVITTQAFPVAMRKVNNMLLAIKSPKTVSDIITDAETVEPAAAVAAAPSAIPAAGAPAPAEASDVAMAPAPVHVKTSHAVAKRAKPAALAKKSPIDTLKFILRILKDAQPVMVFVMFLGYLARLFRR